MVKVGIVGGTGYTGVELLRMLAHHPQVDVVAITSRAEEGLRVDTLYPSLRGYYDLCFSLPDPEKLSQCDIVFFATPHNVAMNTVPELLALDTRIIDLSADFRIRDAAVWSAWYNEDHTCPELLKDVVYGLPEFNREKIRDARLVACPGCYPTAIELGMLPLLENQWVDTGRVIASAASGVSGAGRQAKVDNLFAEVNDSFKAYGVTGHRHLPEIEQTLADIAGAKVSVTFVPHLVPMTRGIQATLYAELLNGALAIEDIQQLFESRYETEPFVDVMPLESIPQTRSVKGSNFCRVAVHRPQGRNTLVILSVIDNLVKGASGQAIQCMNIMLGLDEDAGLQMVALMP